jgi:asparagine synthetase B (glutamine-hydrolysing)
MVKFLISAQLAQNKFLAYDFFMSQPKSIIPAAEFTRNFGRYRMLAQRGALAVSSHGQITGYFVPPEEYEAFQRFQRQRKSFAVEDLSDDILKAISTTEMDPRHDHLNALLDD